MVASALFSVHCSDTASSFFEGKDTICFFFFLSFKFVSFYFDLLFSYDI
uniref:Uncharacterized protein n=1 Tax=Arundo donax TaxID=35708 RepID=A0A0A9A229_ARUDO